MKMIVPVFILSVCDLAARAIEPSGLTCNYGSSTVVESQAPSLSWILTSDKQEDFQTAYEINVAGSESSLLDGKPDMWASGIVRSDRSRGLSYAGKKLEAGKKYYWRVRVWDKDGVASRWSDVGSWIMGLGPTDWKARWIGAIRRESARLPRGRTYHTPGLSRNLADRWDGVDSMASRSIMLRKDFELDTAPVQALVDIAGLGHYELLVNGVKVDSHVFKPLWSDYDNTVYYNTFDIAGLLRQGKNTIGVILGNGMYNVVGGRYTKFRVSFGPPTLLLQARLKYADGSTEDVVSDESWKYDFSPITFNCIFGGEDYDARLEQKGWSTPSFDARGWRDVLVMEAPGGKLVPQAAPFISVNETFGVAKAAEPSPSTFIFDMGQNLSGYPTINVKGRRGDKIRLVPAETSDMKDILQGNSGTPYYFEYTLKGDSIEEWTPMFSYYGYRFLKVEGIDYLQSKKDSLPVLLDLKSNFIHSSASADGSFESSNELFNSIHRIIGNATRSNMQAVLTDCPHREKLGWLEEAHLNGPGLLFNYDLRTLYPKIMNDIKDSQRESGLVPDIAPEYVEFESGFLDSPEWGTAAVMIPWMYYRWYGDSSLIVDYYPVMKRYVDYLTDKSSRHILSHGLGDWYDHGPGTVGVSQNTPIEITATGHYYLAAEYLSKSATLVGNKADNARYAALADSIRNAFNTVLFDPSTMNYGNGSQCSNAIPLVLGIVPDHRKAAVLANLLADIKAHDGKLTTGDVGNRYLYKALSDNGLDEVMYRMHNHYDIPGYGFQIALGVTTLTEQWDPRKGMSWNHFMMGQIEEWFYESLAGIRPDFEAPGFKHFFVAPSPLGDLKYVTASYNSVYGLVESAWKKDNGIFSIDITVPVNTTATYINPVTGESVGLCSGKHHFVTPLTF